MPIKILENVPLAPMTTLQIGGPSRYFVTAETEDDVPLALDFAKLEGIEVFVLGGGSNLVVSDAGFNGLVLKIGLKGTEHTDENSDEVVIQAASGEDWDAFVAQCVDRGLAGVECLSGIPGSVGGTPVQNVGAYGQEVAETIVSVRCLDRQAMQFVELSNEECGFEYRKSIFNTAARERYIVVGVSYALKKNGFPKIVYKDLQEFFEGCSPTLKETRDAVLQIRRSKSMVIDPDDSNSCSAGSFFKNPIVPEEVLKEIAQDLLIPNVPHFRVNEREVKIPAAWLIENAGFSKGFVHGNAGISTNHSLAIINRGGATAKEIISLKVLIQDAVEERFHIRLTPEPVFVGF